MNQFLKNPLIPRINDFPIFESPPIQFVYEQTAQNFFGQYTFNLSKQPMNPDKALLDTALYYIRNITFSMDITEQDFNSSLDTSYGNFQYHLFEEASGGTPNFREPIQVSKFLENFDYQMVILPRTSPNKFQASFDGRLNQTSALQGKQAITAKAVLSVQEITHDGFIEAITRRAFPSKSMLGV